MNRILRVAILTAVVYSTAAAQSSEHSPWWITFGGGAATPGDALTMSAGAVYGKFLGSSIISGRIIGATNDNPTVRRISPTATTYRLTDYGILYGPAWQEGSGILAVGAGIGLVRTSIEQGSNAAVRSAVSLPLEAQAFWQFTDFFGAGLYAYASINNARSFSGVFLAVQLGVFSTNR